MCCWEMVEKLALGWRHRKLDFEGFILVGRTASAVGDLGSSTVDTFWVPLFFVWTVFVRMSFTTQHISAFWYNLVPCAQDPGT